MINTGKRIVVAWIFVASISSCSSGGSKIEDVDQMVNDTLPELSLTENKGFELMQENCFICHFPKPDPDRRSEMIAPPMLRVQEHYKPSFPNKEEFVNAVMAIVNNPLEENTLMPGAVRKFNMMPQVTYDQDELRLIAETLFDYDFGASSHGGRKMSELKLNNGEKWKLNENSFIAIKAVQEKLNNFKSDDISVYNQLGKDVFKQTKSLMMDDAYTGDLFDQIHNFFGSVEGDIHHLMATESIQEANIHVDELKVKFTDFDTYFEK